jgi:hypothetical protein
MPFHLVSPSNPQLLPYAPAPMAALSVVLAALLNNSNSKRKYPMVW